MAKATPQQKQVYDTLVIQALKFVFQNENAQRFAQSAKNNPINALVDTTTLVMKKLKQAAEMAQRNYVGDPKFIIPAGNEIMGHMVEMLVAFGVVPKEQAGQILQAASAEFSDVIRPQQPQRPTGLIAQGA